MGTYEFRLPDIGEGVVEGEVVAWHISAGDSVTEDDPLVDIMTDKANVTIPSPVTGTISSTTGAPGDIIAVGQVCIVFEVDGEGNASSKAVEEPKDETPPEPEPVPEPTPTPAPVAAPAPAPTPTPTPAPAAPVATGGKVLASPVVRRTAREAGVDLSQVSGSGPAGRVTKADLEQFMTQSSGSVVAGVPGGGTPISAPADGVSEIPVLGLRRKIAEQMTKSYTKIPHFSYFEEVDVTDLEALRQWMNSNRNPGQPKLTYLPFIMRALVKLFREGHHMCNSTYDDEAEIVYQHQAVSLGIATTTDRGLFVPVVKNCESRDIWSCASELLRVATGAREGTSSLDDLTGSTFTITSLGRDGGLGATPIINTPEVGILGVHKAIERPVVVDGKITIRRMMNLSSSWDHRIIDGADGAALVQGLKYLLEHPIQIL